MKSYDQVPDSVYKFYYNLCQHYDDVYTSDMLIRDVAQIQVPPKYQSRIRDTIEAARALSLPYMVHDDMLLSYESRELRMALLYRLGYYPAEIDGLFGFESRYFRREGGSGRLGPLPLVDAYRVGPLLEIDPLLLIDQPKIPNIPIESAPWYKSHLVPDVSLNDLVHAWRKQGDYLQSGRMWIVDVSAFVGIVLIRLRDFVEITFTIDTPTSIMVSHWDVLLFSVADALGLVGPAVYTVSAPFRDRIKMRVHRLSFPLTVYPLTRFRTYTRILSPRTEEAMFYYGNFTIFRFPQRNARSAIRAAIRGLWNPLLENKPADAVHCPWINKRVDQG